MITKAEKRDVCIFAAHVDDEMIGCWELLKMGRVAQIVYFFELSEERKNEALEMAKAFGVSLVSLENTNGVELILDANQSFPDGRELAYIDPTFTIMAPNIRDAHPHHKLVNQYAKAYSPTHRVHYYSVDMNTISRRTLDADKANAKLADLLRFYPSQSGLFNNDGYHLFEASDESDITSSIYVNTQFEGIHAYPDAPEEVSFLRFPHRHIFHVNVEVDVFHDDREIEFILFKREIEAFITKNMEKLQHSSCEMIGRRILNYVILKYLSRSCTVKVSEDQENGATVRFNYGY